MESAEGGSRADGILGLGMLAVLAAGVTIVARSAPEAGRAGIALVAAGAAAVLLLGFPLREIASALGVAARGALDAESRRRAALVWEAAARNAWVLAAASGVAGFASVLSSETGSVSRFVSGVGEHATGVALGVLLAVVFAIPAIRLLPSPALPPPGATAPPAWQRGLAGAILLAVLAWPVLAGGRGDGVEPRSWLLGAPAWLMTAGVALAFALHLRAVGRGASVVVALGAAGTVGILLGLTRGLHGFASRSIGDVAGGLMFAISSSYAALAGLGAIGLPLLDADAREGRRPSAAARSFAYGFPLLVLGLLVAAVLLVTIPMETPAG